MQRPFRDSAAWLGAISLGSAALSCAPSAEEAGQEAIPEPAPSDPVTPGSPNVPPRHAAFVELPARTLRFAQAPERLAQTTPARLAYRFAPGSAAGLPLCLVFGGGPGVTSTMMQRSFGVSDTSSGTLGTFCHSLIVDQRNTGLSYNLGRDGVSEGVARFTLGDNNTLSDAFDFVWVLLDVVSRYPELSRLPLLVLGESYGGVRATLVVDFLLNPEAYADDKREGRDAELLEKLTLTESTLGVRLGDNLRFQVHVQPTLAGRRQDEASGRLFEAPESPFYELESELGVTYEACSDQACVPYFNALAQLEEWGRSGYDYREPTGWLERKVDSAERAMESLAGMRELLTVDPLAVDGLGAAERGDAWRLGDPSDEVPDSPFAAELLGTLAPDDRYLVPFNESVFSAFSSPEAEGLGVDWLATWYAEAFLQNCKRVPAFVTRARYDLVNYSDGLLLALAETSGVSAIELELDDAAVRPGWLTVRFENGETAGIRSPEYPSGHGVVGSNSEEFASDLAQWIGQL